MSNKLNNEEFKNIVYDKLITYYNNGGQFKCPSYDIDTSTGEPHTVMSHELEELKKLISLICDVVLEYDKMRD